MKHRQADKLQNWLIAAQKSRNHELVGLVNGIRQDFEDEYILVKVDRFC